MDSVNNKDASKLIADFQSGSLAAFDLIFNQFYAPLCFFGNRIIQDKFAAEDIVQDAFVKLWTRSHDFNALESIKSFLYVSVRNACLNNLEKNKVKLKHDNYLIYEMRDNENTILNHMIEAEVLRQIFAMVDTLPEQCRKVIRMTFEEGKKPKEIADELGVTVSTVNNQKMRGLSLLRNRLSDEGRALAVAIFFPELFHLIK